MLNLYSETAGETVRVGLESIADGNKFVEADATTVVGWQTLRFDFADQHTDGVVYDKFTFFPSFGDAGSGQTYFVDDVRFLDAVPNADPEFAEESVVLTVDEEQIEVFTAAAKDSDPGDTVSYSLDGADAAKFDVDTLTGDVTFKTAPDYETPGSAGGDNTYSIDVVADDSKGGVATQSVQVTVADVTEIVVTPYNYFSYAFDNIGGGLSQRSKKYILDLTALSTFVDDFQLSLTLDGIHNQGSPIDDPAVVRKVVKNDSGQVTEASITIDATEDLPIYYYNANSVFGPNMGGSEPPGRPRDDRRWRRLLRERCPARG